MTRTMYDAVTPSRIPSGATLVAGYVDGRYANLTAMRQRFPHATVVEIAVSWRTRANVLDVETGDATPAEAVKWCTQTMADTDNHSLTIYANASMWSQVVSAFKAAGVTLPQHWVADWDGQASVPAGKVAKQYRNTAGYDLSAVADHWPGVDTAPAKSSATPAKPAAPKPSTSGTYTVLTGDSLSEIAVAHGVSLSALEKANPQIIDPNKIFPGQVLHLPSGSKASALAAQYYTVKSGDNLTDIAKAHGLSLAALEKLNPGIKNPNFITPGEKVRVK